jgi:ABC-type uncharacterized transport system substrate-binding protein
MRVWLRLLLLGLWLYATAGASVRAAPAVVIVSSESSEAYAQAAQALVSELAFGGLAISEVQRMTVAEFAAMPSQVPKLFVALGAQAALALARAQPLAPVLCTLLPRSAFERVLQSSGRKASAQFSAALLDQPLTRQLALVRLALPQTTQLGVLLGPESRSLAPMLAGLTVDRGFKLVQASIGPSEPVFTSLRQVLERADVLLALPDPEVFNANSLQNILLTSFRAGVPMVAFSPAYVRAGALLALYVTPAQIGQQAGEMARAVLQGKALPAQAVDAKGFTISVNTHVARSLDLALDADRLSLELNFIEAQR